MERRARARGHRMLCSLYSNTPDTSYNNLVLNHIINNLYKAFPTVQTNSDPVSLAPLLFLLVNRSRSYTDG